MGKIIYPTMYENGFSEYEKYGLRVKYIKSGKCFKFIGLRPDKVKEEKELGYSLKDIGERTDVLIVDEDTMFKMIEADDKGLGLFEVWSYGYKGKMYVNTEREVYMREKERVARISYEDYLMLSVWQYKYCISKSIMKRVKSSCVWKELKIRTWSGGREKGKKVEVDNSELLFFCRHNKEVAISKRSLYFYLEARKEECKLLGVKYDKDAEIVAFNTCVK